MSRITALVPLRGGSKSIPKKNIKPISGKPLCTWVLEAALASQVFDQVYVSTDSIEIANVVSSLNLGVAVLMRPSELATDTATTEAVMLHLMEQINFDILCTIQATSPLVRAEDFRAALDKFEVEKLDSLLTGVRLKRFFWESDGTPLNYDPTNRPMRQQFQGTFMENGAFYLTRREILEQRKSRLGGKIGIYEMAEDTAVELDEPEDWIEVEKLLRKRNEKSLFARLKRVKLLVMDCDGVLTDAGMYYSENGEELKKFNTRDGQGIALLRKKGIKTAIITGEDSQIVKRRAEKLKIDFLYIGVKDKQNVIAKLIKDVRLEPSEVAYIGDDINDHQAMELAGFSFAVNDALHVIKGKADYILESNGGKGAVREVCDIILGYK